MLITFYDSFNILTKVYSQGAFLKQAILDTRIDEQKRNTTTKIVYGVLDKDIELNYIINKFCDKTPKLAIRTILKIGLYCIIYLNIANHEVTNSLVELTKKLGKGGSAGFVNAVLRNYLRDSELNLENNIKGISIKYSYPEFAVRRILDTYKEQGIEILKADKEHTFVRFNTGINGEEYLKNLRFSYEKTPFENCFLVNGFKLQEGFYNGDYTFQSVGSVAISSLVGSGEKLLDTCSAPGGKSVYLSNNFKEIIACDIHPHRVELIKSYYERMNKTNVKEMVLDATIYNKDFKNYFDTVLIDAPCSGYGVIKDNPDIKLRRTEEDIKSLNETQYKIINNVKSYVKNGGYLCYSTCSIFKEENDNIIEKFLKHNKNFIIINVTSKLDNIQTKYGLQFLPNISMGAGFYFCKLQRVDNNESFK